MITLDWLDFADEIKLNNRFFPQKNRVLRFIDEIFDQHIEILEKGTNFYRARITDLNDMAIQDKVLIGFPEKGSMLHIPVMSHTESGPCRTVRGGKSAVVGIVP